MKRGVTRRLITCILVLLVFPLIAAQNVSDSSAFQTQSALIEIDDSISSDDFFHDLATRISTEYNISFEEALAIVQQNEIDFDANTTLIEEPIVPDTNVSLELIEQPQEEHTNVQGELLVVDNNDTGFSDVYVELIDNVTQTVNFEFLPRTQNHIIVDQPAVFEQIVKVYNPLNEIADVEFNIHNFRQEIGEDFLDDIVTVTIALDRQIISDTAVALFAVDPFETVTLDVTYSLSPVELFVDCTQQTIQDLLPIDAEIVTSTIPVDTLVSKECAITIDHVSKTHYKDVLVNLTQIVNEPIASIYHVEKDELIVIHDGIIELEDVN